MVLLDHEVDRRCRAAPRRARAARPSPARHPRRASPGRTLLLGAVAQPAAKGAAASAGASASAKRTSGEEVTNRRSLPEGIGRGRGGFAGTKAATAASGSSSRDGSDTLGLRGWCTLPQHEAAGVLAGAGRGRRARVRPRPRRRGAGRPRARSSIACARRASRSARASMMRGQLNAVDVVELTLGGGRSARRARARRDAGAGGDAGRRTAPTRSISSPRCAVEQRPSKSTASRSASAPGRATTTCCCPAPATPATASSRGAPRYPPLLTERADIGPHVPPIVPDIPRLSAAPGRSSLVADAGDLATPALAVHVPAARLGIIVLARPAVGDGRRVAGRRGGGRPQTGERRASLGVGRGEVPVRVHVFDCADVPALFERLFLLRKELTGPTALVHELPFSAAFAAHEARVNGRWIEKPGILALGERATPPTDLADRLVRRLATTLPLIAAGSKQSRERALATSRSRSTAARRRRASSTASPTARPGTTTGSPCRRPPRAAARRRLQQPRWHLVRRSAER